MGLAWVWEARAVSEHIEGGRGGDGDADCDWLGLAEFASKEPDGGAEGDDAKTN